MFFPEFIYKKKTHSTINIFTDKQTNKQTNKINQKVKQETEKPTIEKDLLRFSTF